MWALRSNSAPPLSERAEEKEIRTMGYFEGKGVYVGGWLKKYAGAALLLQKLKSRPKATQLYLRHNGPEHIMVFAPTRSGKGVGLILPTLLAWEGSSIVLDIKGENWALTAGWRKSQEQVVLRVDPSDPSGASARFNPLEEIRLATLLAIPDVQNMAAMLVDPTGKGLEDHWSKAAFAMLGGAILHCCIMTRHAQKRTVNSLFLRSGFFGPRKNPGSRPDASISKRHNGFHLCAAPGGVVCRNASSRRNP